MPGSDGIWMACQDRLQSGKTSERSRGEREKEKEIECLCEWAVGGYFFRSSSRAEQSRAEQFIKHLIIAILWVFFVCLCVSICAAAVCTAIIWRVWERERTIFVGSIHSIDTHTHNILRHIAHTFWFQVNRKAHKNWLLGSGGERVPYECVLVFVGVFQV